MVCVGFPTLLLAVRRPHSGVGTLEFVGDVGQLLLFAALVARALLLRRTDPAAHRRLILLATATLMLPALARWPWNLSLPQFAMLYFAAPAVLIAWELRSLHRIHRATLLGVGLMVLLFIGTVLLSLTPAVNALVAWVRAGG